MACSPARLLANRQNSLRSTGPKTTLGKAVARRNAWKHGMTGSGVVIPGEDGDAVVRLADELHPDIAPGLDGAMARILVRRVAVMSVRLDRCVLQEKAALAEKVRAAGAAFDEEARARADHLLSWIATEPATNHRQLLAFPEGVQVLLDTMRTFRAAVLMPGVGSAWDMIHAQRFDECTGRRSGTVPFSRCRGLSLALLGDFTELGPDDAADLPPRERAVWARDAMAGLIDAEIRRLETHLDALDPAQREQSRTEAAQRALFDPERDATLARKYEAAAERGMYRAIRELKELRLAAADPATIAQPADAVAPYEAEAADLADLPELTASDSEFQGVEPEPTPEDEPPASDPRPRPRPRRRRRELPTRRRLASFGRNLPGGRIDTKKAEPVGAGSAWG